MGSNVEFNKFVVHITRPLQYQISAELMRDLLQVGSFNGVSDGREATHGQVFISGFELRDPASSSSKVSWFTEPDLGRTKKLTLASLLIITAAFVAAISFRETRHCCRGHKKTHYRQAATEPPTTAELRNLV